MEHERQTVAESQNGTVENCSCGTIHLTYYNMTLRLSHEDFDELTELLRAAAQALHGVKTPPAPAVGEGGVLN
jgi:hypothetical protein